MKPVSLVDDLAMLAAQHPQLDDLRLNFEASAAHLSSRPEGLVQVARCAGLDRYATLALLLKAEAQLHADEPGMWQPWRDAERFSRLLGEADSLGEGSTAVLLLEQCALSCHIIGQQEVAPLALRHATERAQLAAACAEATRSFLTDKRAWLLDELQLDWLLALRQQLVEELESTRVQYLAAMGDALVEYIAAAHRIALMRYRCAMNDPTLSMDDLASRLRQALDTPDNANPVIELEAELRLALLDTVQGVQADRAALQRLSALWSQGEVRQADQADREHAALLFRRLARMIHPDALERHDDYAAIAPENQRRLKEIWHQASATHGTRAFLSQERLVNYVEHLEGWIAEADRILRCMTFHAPSRLLEGATLEARHDDLRRAIADVARHLHAVRDDISHLEFDPQHEQYRRIIAMSDDERSTERARMATLATHWNDEARRLATTLSDRLAKRDADGTPGGQGSES